MKKTEKIEVRVSVEEKDRLGKMAERRGQSVSDMIRERMSEDVGAIPKHIKINRIVSWLALVCALIALIWMSIFNSKPRELSYPLMSTIYVHAYRPEMRAATYKLPHLDAYTEKHKFFAFDHNFELSFNVEEQEGGLFLLKTKICKIVEDECIEDQENENILSFPAKHVEPAGFFYIHAEDEKIDILIRGPRLEFPKEETG